MYVCVNFVFSLSLAEDAFFMCPDRLRLPLIFYYGHTASVYVNKLLQAEFIQVFCYQQRTGDILLKTEFLQEGCVSSDEPCCRDIVPSSD